MLFALASSGCYYSHLASGQIKLLWARQPIDAVISDPATPPQTTALLQLVGDARRFAAELGLEVGDQYTSFVEWPGDRIVTTIVRTRPASVDAVPFWFPVIGKLPYKGYFDRLWAEEEALHLEQDDDYEVCVSGVSAYSTLGWIDDPITSPMLDRGAAYLVETILHELVHATVFFSEEVDFSESVAQFIGQEAAILFFDQPAFASSPASIDQTIIRSAASDVSSIEWPDAERVRDTVFDRRLVGEALADFREELSSALESSDAIDLDALREGARKRLAALPLRVLDPERIAERARLTNPCLALRGTYVRDLPRHAEVLAALGGDLPALIQRLRKTAEDDLGPEAFYAIVVDGGEGEGEESSRDDDGG